MERGNVVAGEDSATGGLIFQRGKTWQDFVRSYSILVDGKLVGQLKRSSELVLELAPGEYTCQAKVSWTGSKVVRVEVNAGAITRLQVLPGDEGDRVERAQSADKYLRIVVKV